MEWMPGKVVAGYGVASGRGKGEGGGRRYPDGTIRLQQPFFLEKGIDLSGYFPGTLNVDVAPRKPIPTNALFDGAIRWFDDIEERFVIAPAKLEANGRQYSGVWYYPHPETKPAHVQPQSVVELLLPWIDGIAVGDAVCVGLFPFELQAIQATAVADH